MKTNVFTVFFASMLTYGCISTPRQAILIDVPFHPQELTNHCGVISLAMTLDYYDVTYSITNLVDQAFISILNGSSLELLADTANKYGLDTEIDHLSIDKLQQIISAKHIPIIYLAPINNTEIGHFAIITGISSDSKKLRIHEPDLPNHWLRASKLKKRATAGVFPALIISKH